ncbi:MAG: ABC transporter permease subunit [Pseudomonadota bacterium]
MTHYFLRRMALIIPTFIGVTLLVFFITRMVPGGPIEKMLSEMQQMNGDRAARTMVGATTALSPDQMDELKRYYGFDKPVLVSYFTWLGKVLTFDLGQSTRYNEPVWDIIKSRFPISIFYGLVTMLLTYLVCVPLGIFKALHHQRLFDNITSILIFIGYAIPGYVVGIALIYLMAAHWDLFPLGGFKSENFADMNWGQKAIDILYHSVLPLIAYMAGSFAMMAMLMKNSMMDNLSADYVRTAMAKGLSFRQAVTRHALRNSLIPIATSFGHNISFILTGSFLIETIFNIDGFGLLGYESVVQRDYPLVLGILVLSSLLFMVGNILSDICVALVDPRVQFN